MTFRDAQLQKHYEKVVSIVRGCPPDQVPICALLDAWYWFRLVEGDDSPRTKEAIEHLLSSELRPGLRNWYQRSGDDMNPNALDVRNQLSELAGEKFG